MATEKTDKKAEAKPEKPKEDKPLSAKAAAQKAAGKKAKESRVEVAEEAKASAATPARLRVKYGAEVVPALMKEFGYKNAMQVPKLTKVVVNMGLGEALANNKLIDSAVDQLALITGQKAVVTRSRKAIANFKLRADQPIGA